MIEVLGRDPARGVYRISVGPERILVSLPEDVIADDRPLTGGHGHATAYDWIARNAGRIQSAIDARKTGGRVAAPFDRLSLEEDH